MTVKSKIALYITGAGLVASLLFSAAVFLELIDEPFDLLDKVLKEEAYRVAGIILEGHESGCTELLYPDSPALATHYWIKLQEKDTNRVLYQSGLADLITLPWVRPGGRAVVGKTIPREKINLHQDRWEEVTFRVRSFALEENGKAFILQIARPMEELEEDLWELLIGIVSGLAFSTLILIALSRFMAGKILRPIGQLKSLAQDFSEKNLDQRIPVGAEKDEFSELIRTINNMLDRLQYSFARQRNFLFDTSHELKTPLTTIRLAVDELNAHGQKLPHFINENLLRLNNQVLRMERLVKDLLNLSKLETLTRIDKSSLDLGKLLSSLAEEYRFLADARAISIELQLPKRFFACGDPEKLQRAFSNLMDNAIKYNTDGGRVEIKGRQDADDVTVTVCNTGPGVAKEEISKLFDQFYRVEKSRSTQHGGSGLGLAIVKRIVELHGGKIDIESQKENWTRVTIVLSRKQDFRSLS